MAVPPRLLESVAPVGANELVPALPRLNDGKLIRVRVAARLEQHVGGLELGLHGSRTRVDVLLHGRDDAGLRDNDGLQGAGVLATHTVWRRCE